MIHSANPQSQFCLILTFWAERQTYVLHTDGQPVWKQWLLRAMTVGLWIKSNSNLAAIWNWSTPKHKPKHKLEKWLVRCASLYDSSLVLLYLFWHHPFYCRVADSNSPRDLEFWVFRWLSFEVFSPLHLLLPEQFFAYTSRGRSKLDQKGADKYYCPSLFAALCNN